MVGVKFQVVRGSRSGKCEELFIFLESAMVATERAAGILALTLRTLWTRRLPFAWHTCGVVARQ